MDGRRRVRDGQRTTVGELAGAERLRPAPLVVFPAEFDQLRQVSPQALVAFRGNSYSVPLGLGGAQVHVRHRLSADQLRIVTARGATVAVHHRAPMVLVGWFATRNASSPWNGAPPAGQLQRTGPVYDLYSSSS